MELRETVKRLLICNVKGGVGKTALALNLSLTYGYAVVTNDRASILKSVLSPAMVKVLEQDEEIPCFLPDSPIIYDFGGYIDERTQNVIDEAEFVIIPVLGYQENYQITLNFIEEMLSLKAAARILVVINRTRGEQFKKTEYVLWNFFPELNILNVKCSSAFAWMCREKKSIRELANQYPSYRRHWSPVGDQFDAIAKKLLVAHSEEIWTV